MVAVGIDPHKKTHTAVSIDSVTGQVIREIPMTSNERGHGKLRWHLHDLETWSSMGIPPRALDRPKWLTRIEETLASDIKAPERELCGHIGEFGSELLAVPGCASLLAARIVGQAAGAKRFSGEAAWAMHTGSAPLVASSGEKVEAPTQSSEQAEAQQRLALHSSHPDTHPPAW